jgi:hypothetical protein
MVSSARTAPKPKETSMTQHARGPFDVELAPLAPYNTDATARLGRFSIDKQFHGALDATSKGEMLSSGSANGSGGYVAIEYVSGTLDGRRGGFALQHTATMTRGVPHLEISVVPGSGSGDLQGLTGRMNIVIAAGGPHSYELEYSFEQ